MNLLRRFLEHRHLPLFLAIGAILIMLPALKVGLVADDLPQRAVALKPSQLPPHFRDTGNPADSGSFRTVLRDYFFSAYNNPQNVALAKSYGMLPWWTPDSLRLGLWRPVTAFTHWLDYQLYPESPALMHAQNIAWFAAIIFLVTVMYRRLINVKWVAGLAALLFLLDGNTYFPVMFVANRGFMMALFFGLVCFYEHHQWRTTKSRTPLALSALFLALSLFADEGGASTLAFILAYALVLETGNLRARALTVLPAILVIVVWRTIYESLGFGLHNLRLYIDPAHEPLEFVGAVIPRAIVLLGAQISQIVPELLIVVKPAFLLKAELLYCLPLVAALLVFFPLLRRNKTAQFWFTIMILAAIPAATVAPLSKNLGFVAVGFYGLMATFIGSVFEQFGWSSAFTRRTTKTLPARLKTELQMVGNLTPQQTGAGAQLETQNPKLETASAPLATRTADNVLPASCRQIHATPSHESQNRKPETPTGPLPPRHPTLVTRLACILLLIAHMGGAITERALEAYYAPAIFKNMAYYGNISNPPDAENKHVIVLNSPCALFMAYAPGCKAYYHQPLPKSMRTLVPGCTRFTVERADDHTLVLQSLAPNIFACDDVGTFNAVYGVAFSNVILGALKAKPGDRFDLGTLKVEILQTDASSVPSRVAFHFDHSLDAPDFHWLKFDWETSTYQPFTLPAPGQCVTLSGPSPWRGGSVAPETARP